MEVYADPTNLSESIWSLEPVSAGTYNILVRSGDPRFHLGTNYYLSVIQINNAGKSSAAVTIVQTRFVQSLPNGIPQKFLFTETFERVKFFAFQVPVKSLNHTVSVKITSLDEDQSFYPTVYLRNYQSDKGVLDFSGLPFPTIIDYERKLGDSLSDVYETQQEYTFGGSCDTNFCYYLVSMYQNSYGLNDIRKPEFLLMFTAM